jgi:glycosyltransferase involved in cell wall biosynthesis
MIEVSVIMACYNAAKYIAHSIESVVNQTFTDLELIIVDDFSTDDSLMIARKAALVDSRIKVYSLNKNGGAGAARNFAIDKASGEWISILDADDVFLPTKIERQMEIVYSSGSNLVLIGSDSYEIDLNGTRFSLQKYPVSSKNLKSHLARQKRFPPHSSLMYRTSIVRSLGGYDNRLCPSEDYNLWLHLSSKGMFASVPEPLVEYRHHKTNISKANSGFDQLKWGFVAAISHFIRTRNQPDPLCYTSIKDWNEFVNWLAIRLEKEKILDYRHKKEEWRNIFYQRDSKTKWIFNLVKNVFTNPLFLWNVLYEKLRGTILPELLAIEWIEKFKSDTPAEKPSR